MSIYKSLLGTFLTATITSACAFASAAPALAQSYPGAPGVANVSVANGYVTIVRGDSGAQVAATINAPLMPGDYIATGAGSDAEVQFDGISMLRLAQSTQVRFVNLDPSSREMQLASGTIDLAELQGADGSPQIDTPSLTLRPSQSGDYRVSVLGNGQTLVTVRSGEAAIATGAGWQTLTPGSTLVAYGPYSNPSTVMQGAIAWDSFDQFNASRDHSMVSAYNSNPYLAPTLAGYSNFANYGQWQNVPGYGYAWAPNNQSQTNFAPYQNGQWVWEPGYGYTWVANEPWGYAPSHYGSWLYRANYGGWLWQPPAYQTQTTSASLASAWLPALVTFFLTGNNGGNTGGLLSGLLGGLLGNSGYPSYYNNASIGWIPLAPGEQYQPWYGQNASYPASTVANVTNITNIYNYYGNARYYGGIMMVPISAWRAGNFRHTQLVRSQRLKQIVLIRGAIPIVPTTANLHCSSVTVVKHPVVLSRTFITERFAAKAPVLTRFSFKTQQVQIQRIASIRPKIVSLPAHIVIAHPVYHPVLHPLIHALTIAKPAVHRTVAKPVLHKALITKPVLHKTIVTKPVLHKAMITKPVLHKAMITKPVLHKTIVTKPVLHKIIVTKPMLHKTIVTKPMLHKTSVRRPVRHPAKATPRPSVHPSAPPAA